LADQRDGRRSTPPITDARCALYNNAHAIGMRAVESII